MSDQINPKIEALLLLSGAKSWRQDLRPYRNDWYHESIIWVSGLDDDKMHFLREAYRKTCVEDLQRVCFMKEEGGA